MMNAVDMSLLLVKPQFSGSINLGRLLMATNLCGGAVQLCMVDYKWKKEQ